MPLLLLVIALLLPVVFLCAILLAPVQRYRVGTARRLARRWVATSNLILLIVSAAFFLWAMALTNFWVPDALKAALLGFFSGGILGLLGLALTRWEVTPRTLHYTPNRWLVLLLTLAVLARLLYSVWRAWHTWGTSGSGASWLAQSGLAGSIAVGAVVIGYYIIYTAGVWRRIGAKRFREA